MPEKGRGPGEPRAVERDEEHDSYEARLEKEERKFLKEVREADSETQKILALKAIKEGDGWMVSQNLTKFQCLDKEVAMAMFEMDQVPIRLEDFGLFSDLDKEAFFAYVKVCKKRGLEWGRAAKYFSGLDKEIAKFLIAEGGVSEFISSLSNSQIYDRWDDNPYGRLDAPVHATFSGIDKETLLSAISALDKQTAEGRDKYNVHTGYLEQEKPRPGILHLVAGLNYFSDLDQEAFDVLDSKMKNWNEMKQLYRHLHSFTGLSSKVLKSMMKGGAEGEELAMKSLDAFSVDLPVLTMMYQKQLEKFKNPTLPSQQPLSREAHYYGNYEDYEPEPTERQKKKALSLKHLRNCKLINDRAEGKIDPALARISKDLGDDFSLEEYDLYQSLLRGESPEAAKELGVTSTGDEGLVQLREGLKKVTKEIVSGSIDAKLVLRNPVVRRVFVSQVRYEDSEWGTHDDSSFDDIVDRFAFHPRLEHLKYLPEAYAPSPVMRIAKIDKETKSEKPFPEDFLVRYNQMLDSLRVARSQRKEQGEMGIQQIIESIQRKMVEVKKDLADKLQKTPNELAKKNIQENIQKLDGVRLNELSPQEQFGVLRSFKGKFDGELRELMFFMGYHFNQNYLEKDLDTFSGQNPTLDEVTWVLNFVDHIVNKETLSKYFTDKEAAKSFKGLVNVAAIEKGMEHFRDQGTKGTMDMRFVPDRGLLTEFSGHIADACWASKNILDSHPNMLSLLMIQNPDSKFERLAGASMLIETESDEGERLLIIRGLNPQQNVINQLSVPDFFKQCTDYLKDIARKDGRKLAIVIDDHSGGASTNRPALMDYLSLIQANNISSVKLRQIVLASADDTEFNGYNIVKKCYVIE